MSEPLPRPSTEPVVNSYNEWDPLEEVIVGNVDGAIVPSWHLILDATMPQPSRPFFRRLGGQPFPDTVVAAARQELEELVRIFEGEGVVVRRPDPYEFHRSFSTPDWASTAGLYAAMPRDVFLVVGNDIIEAPMAFRCRYFETNPYKSLLKEYFLAGGRWTAAPKPELKDELYDSDYVEPTEDEPVRYVLTEFEPTFDAADFARCGRDIFVQKSNVTNDFGIEWMRRHLGDEYRIHVLEVTDNHPMHLDATFVPLAPGKVLINPDRIGKLPPMFDTWDVLVAPRPSMTSNASISMCTDWISMNVVSIDERRVVVEKNEEPMIRQLKDWGFEPIPTSLKNFNSFGGGFHCCTLDIRRRGTLESYF